MDEASPEPRFARDQGTLDYYGHRAAEYDEWYLGTGAFAERERPGWKADLDALCATIDALPAAKTLDIACGTGFLTKHLRGSVVGIDQSREMVSIAQQQVPGGVFLEGDALALPFANSSFDRVFTGHFYGHLGDVERSQFFAEARRVADELVVVDSARRPDAATDGWQVRVLNDGSRHRVYKRYFGAEGLASEVGGASFYTGRYFVAVRVSWCRREALE